MDIETFRDYCMAKKGVTESFPFDDRVLVFKVMNKMFALTNVEEYTGINLKCDPDRAIELREQYSEIVPGYHMSKKHWNTVDPHGSLHQDFLKGLIDDSYNLIVSSLTKKLQAELAAL